MAFNDLKPYLYYKNNTGALFNMDCLDGMKLIPDNSIDLTVTSPPYDNLRKYNGFSFDFEGIAKELFRATKIGGVVVWVVGDSTINGSESGTNFKQALYFKEIGFNLHDTMIYAKNNPIPTVGKRYHQHFEYIFILSRGNVKTFNPIKEQCKYKGVANMKNRGVDGSLNYKKIERTTDKKVGNIFYYSIGGGITTKDKVAFEHPAIFPERLAEDMIISWSNEKDLILDPFMGSGTTAKMAILNNRKFIGFEISEEYCENTKKRLEDLK